MAVRILTALIGLPLIVLVTIIGNTPFYLAIAVIALLGLREYFEAMSKKSMRPMKYTGYLTAILLFLLIMPNSFLISEQIHKSFSNNAISILVLAVIAMLLKTIFQHSRYDIISAAITLFGLIYVIIMFIHLYLIRIIPRGEYLIWFVFITAWSTDTFAYFSGYFFGKRKLCPEISPKKTVEGAVGGIIGSVIFNGIYGYSISKIVYAGTKMEIGIILFALVVGFIGSIFAQCGDLVASTIKRYVGIKDYSNLIPGHGGILDRFDSIIFISPIISIMLSWLLSQ